MAIALIAALGVGTYQLLDVDQAPNQAVATLGVTSSPGGGAGAQPKGSSPGDTPAKPAPTSATPTTAAPTTAVSTTIRPTTLRPTTGAPTTASPNTAVAAPATPSTVTPSTAVPAAPTTAAASTAAAPTNTAASGSYTHYGLYQDGKLYLIGSVPSQAYVDKFTGWAAEVLGTANVVNQLKIDPKVPPPTTGIVRVGEEVLFPSGSAQISDSYHAVAALGVAVMQLYPNATMTIIGHTDDVGSVEENYALSLARARAVADYLAELGGLDPARFTALGRGPSQPAVPNDSAENRAKNRRIEVEINGLFK